MSRSSCSDTFFYSDGTAPGRTARCHAARALGSTATRGASAMVNCIGVMPDRDSILAVPGAHLHDYGKEARPGRKLGHVTVTATDEATLGERLASVEVIVGPRGSP